MGHRALEVLARPEVWPVVGLYALYLWFSERSWWPLLVGVPLMLALWILPDWAGSGELFHTFHSATISGEPTDILDIASIAELLRRQGWRLQTRGTSGGWIVEGWSGPYRLHAAGADLLWVWRVVRDG